MNERELGIRRAEDEAKKLNKRFGVRSASHIKVLLYPPALGVKVVVGKLEGSLAMLSMGRKPTIRVSDRPCHPGDPVRGAARGPLDAPFGKGGKAGTTTCLPELPSRAATRRQGPSRRRAAPLFREGHER